MCVWGPELLSPPAQPGWGCLQTRTSPLDSAVARPTGWTSAGRGAQTPEWLSCGSSPHAGSLTLQGCGWGGCKAGRGMNSRVFSSEAWPSHSPGPGLPAGCWTHRLQPSDVLRASQAPTLLGAVYPPVFTQSQPPAMACVAVILSRLGKERAVSSEVTCLGSCTSPFPRLNTACFTPAQWLAAAKSQCGLRRAW